MPIKPLPQFYKVINPDGVTLQYPLVETWDQIADQEIVLNAYGCKWKPILREGAGERIDVVETYECGTEVDSTILKWEWRIYFPNLDLSK